MIKNTLKAALLIGLVGFSNAMDKKASPEYGQSPTMEQHILWLADGHFFAGHGSNGKPILLPLPRRPQSMPGTFLTHDSYSREELIERLRAAFNKNKSPTIAQRIEWFVDNKAFGGYDPHGNPILLDIATVSNPTNSGNAEAMFMALHEHDSSHTPSVPTTTPVTKDPAPDTFLSHDIYPMEPFIVTLNALMDIPNPPSVKQLLEWASQGSFFDGYGSDGEPILLSLAGQNSGTFLNHDDSTWDELLADQEGY